MKKKFFDSKTYTAPAVSVKVNTGTPVIYYVLRDYLGSITHVVKSNLTTTDEYSFDACSVKPAFCEPTLGGETKGKVELIPISEAIREVAADKQMIGTVTT